MTTIKVSELPIISTPYNGSEYTLGIQNSGSVKVPALNLAAATGASLVGTTPSGTLAASTVAASLTELDTEKASTTALIASTGSTLVGTTTGGTGAVTRTVASKLNDVVSVKDFGAIGNGVADDTAALILGNNSAGGLYFPQGSYNVTSNITFSDFCNFEAGAILNIATDVVVRFNKGFFAPVQQAFHCVGTATVTFNFAFTDTGHPEWWGAVANSSGADCSIGINAAIIALKTTVLMAADYYCSSTVLMQTEHRKLIGSGAGAWAAIGDCTRVLVKSATLTVLKIGPNTIPAGGINNFQKDNYISEILFTRTIVPDVNTQSASVLIQFTLYTEIVHCLAYESMTGFLIKATAQTHISHSYAFRSTAGTGGTDYWYGFYLDGRTSIGSGGNASTYITECNASVGGLSATFNSAGVYADGGAADLFLTDFESTSCYIGVNLTQTASQNGQCNIHLRNPIADAFYFAGVYITGTAATGAIEITGGYSAPVASPANTSWGVRIVSSLAAIAITGHQIVASPATLTGGLLIQNSTGIVAMNNMWTECNQQGVYITGSSNCYIADHIKNTRVTTNAAVTLAGTNSRIKMDMTISGGATGVFEVGYQLQGTGTTLSEFRCSGLDAAAITPGSADKLIYNGTSIIASGAFGTNNLAQGIMV